MSVAAINPGPVSRDLETSALIAIITHAHQDTGRAVVTALSTARLAGEALLIVQERVGQETWKRWIEANLPVDYEQCKRYMRIATFWPAAEASGATSINGALAAISAAGLTRRTGPPSPFDKALEQRARALVKEGATQKEVAVQLGVSRGTVQKWLNPAQEKRRQKALSRKRSAALKALKKQEDAKMMRSAGPEIDALWKQTVALAKKVDRAALAETGDTRAALNSALQSLYKAEDALIQAGRARVVYSHSRRVA